jgi:hypothetical protein
VQRVLLSAIDNAQGDRARAQKNLEAWFASTMERVSGWYRRRTQLHIFVIALTLVLALNLNSFAIADYLWREDFSSWTPDTTSVRPPTDTPLMASESSKDYRDLQSLSLPIGWDRTSIESPASIDGRARLSYWTKQVLGLLFTAFVVMFGAPFCFDMLRKVAAVRSTVSPRLARFDVSSSAPLNLSDEAIMLKPVLSDLEQQFPSFGSASLGNEYATAASNTLRETAPDERRWADGHDEGLL